MKRKKRNSKWPNISITESNTVAAFQRTRGIVLDQRQTTLFAKDMPYNEKHELQADPNFGSNEPQGNR